MSDAVTSRSSELAHLNYDDLIAAIEELTPATGDQAESWRTLRAICEDLRDSEAEAPITTGCHWLLREITIEGYRGANSMVKLALDPHPGVTVIHGPNGAGKSTLAEALRAALWGEPGRSFIGEARTPGALWKPVELNKLATNAQMQVLLSDETRPARTLDLKTTLSKNTGDIELASSGWLKDSDDGTEMPITNRAAFHAALISAPPVLAYADMANDLREIRHLKDWLTASLGMGPRLSSLEAVVDSKAEESTKLNRSLEAARQTAQNQLELVDETALSNGYPIAGNRDIPIFENDEARDQWLVEHDISDRTKADDMYEQDSDDQLHAFCTELLEAFAELTEASSTRGTYSTALKVLLEAGSTAIGNPREGNEECPACGSYEHDWREHTRRLLLGSKEYEQRSTAVTKFVQRCSAELLIPLGRVVRITKLAAPNMAGIRELAELLDLASKELAPGALWAPDALPQLNRLAVEILSATGITLRKEAISKSNALHDWQCRRWASISEYLDLWKKTYTAAAAADSWRATKARATSLTRHFRHTRNAALSGGIDENVSTLLEEFGLRVGSLRITKTEADFGLTDLNDKPVALGELSAGQRNALILAPMLATAESSLFGFTMLDDPVHAFDEFRVDHLAEILANIGAKQRLIVTTHDGRLVEQLRVHCGKAFQLLDISRDPSSATISLESRTDPATELIDSAAQIIGLIKDQSDPAPNWASVEALLRMSIDEALSACFHHSVISLDGASRQARLKQFESLDTLDDRFAHLSQSPDLPDADRSKLDDVKLALGPHLTRWSGAIHNNQQISPLTYDEVTAQKNAAKSACKAILKVGR